MIADEYYIVDSQNGTPFAYLTWKEFDHIVGEFIEPGTDLHLQCADPTPTKWTFGDFMDYEGIVSAKAKTCLEGVLRDVSKVQFVPVTIHTPDGDTDDNHFYLNPMQRIEAVDMENSDYEEEFGGIVELNKLLLDESALASLEEEARLIIRLDEYPTALLVHARIKEAVEAAALSGFLFRKAHGWGGVDSIFDD